MELPRPRCYLSSAMVGHRDAYESLGLTWIRLACGALLLVGAGMLGLSCSDDEQPAGCGPDTCPDGCCSSEQCVPPSATSCGFAGAACRDCTADGTTDTCSEGVCICAATGTRCSPGTYCTSNGCGDCPPDCKNKCAGADDGCSGVCVNDDCPAGCCASDGTCVTPGEQSAASCGAAGDECVSCVDEPRADTCEAGTCVCGATGALCAEGTYCSSAGCGACQPDCTGKCAGADDGCEGVCVNNDCTDGCCDADAQCIPYSAQGPSQCGVAGDRCTDCTSLGYSCDGTVHTCLSSRTNDALFVDQNVPLSMTPGELVNVSVTMRNIGTASWDAAGSYRLGAYNPQDNSTWGLSRVELGSSDSIAPGQAKTFAFQVTAPQNAGIVNFQWRMLQEGVEWFGDLSDYAPITVRTPSITVCEAVRALADTQTDATAGIQACLDAATAGAVVELPAGAYRLDGQVAIASVPITLRTEGTDPDAPRCSVDDHSCAELSASSSFSDTGGLLLVSAAGTVVDHLVLNGNKSARASSASGQQCGQGNNAYGFNMRITANDCALLNSVSKNALCGTGCEVAGSRSHIVLWHDSIVDNGVHDQQGMWSDGVTVHDAASSTVAACDFLDNTDVDLIFGGCQSCVIQDNTIAHTDALAGGAFAALMIHAWPSTSGNYNGTHTTGNVVDCGASRRCGFGLLLGSDAWYVTDVYGGSAYRNPVSNAQIGVALDDVHNMQIFDNRVTTPASTTTTSCGVRAAHAYTRGSRSHDIDTSLDTMGTSYTSTDYDGCIPNWWQ